MNNHIVLEDGMYYKFTDDSSKTKLLACTGSSLCELETDKLAGRAGGENEERAGFWRIPSGFFTVEADCKVAV